MNDLEAVRLLSQEPTDQSVSNTWHRLTRLQAQARPARRSMLLIPVAAAAAVGVAGAGAFALTRRRGEQEVADNPLEALARAAEATKPIELKPGQLIYSDMRFFDSRRQEHWTDPNDMLPVKVMIDGEDPGARTVRLMRVDGEAAKLWTPQWLAKQPTDPKQLLERLRAEARKFPGSVDSSVDPFILQHMGRSYRICEIAYAPAVRAALIRAYAKIPGITAKVVGNTVELSIGSRQGGLIFESGTGRCIGEIGFMTWTQAIVNEKARP